MIKAPDDVDQVFAAIEARCRGLLRKEGAERLDELWCHCARSDEFGQSV